MIVLSALRASQAAANEAAEAELANFNQKLSKLEADPSFAIPLRHEEQLERALSARFERVPIRFEKSHTDISPRASSLIVACEVTNQLTYAALYQHPIWPRGQSGVTIGIGYDIGGVDKAFLKTDWSPYLDETTLLALSQACVKTGPDAAKLIGRLRSVTITWDVAQSQYAKETLPRYVGETESALPNTKALSQDSLGALVSLVYNRGATFSYPGDRYNEMRAIKELMSLAKFDEIPAQIRSMKRLWVGDPDMKGLLLRRDAEASLFAFGLTRA
jgi:GH24 family phage-related lysozyme (muramidase)